MHSTINGISEAALYLTLKMEHDEKSVQFLWGPHFHDDDVTVHV